MTATSIAKKITYGTLFPFACDLAHLVAAYGHNVTSVQVSADMGQHVQMHLGGRLYFSDDLAELLTRIAATDVTPYAYGNASARGMIDGYRVEVYAGQADHAFHGDGQDGRWSVQGCHDCAVREQVAEDIAHDAAADAHCSL